MHVSSLSFCNSACTLRTIKLILKEAGTHACSCFQSHSMPAPVSAAVRLSYPGPLT